MAADVPRAARLTGPTRTRVPGTAVVVVVVGIVVVGTVVVGTVVVGIVVVVVVAVVAGIVVGVALVGGPVDAPPGTVVVDAAVVVGCAGVRSRPRPNSC